MNVRSLCLFALLCLGLTGCVERQVSVDNAWIRTPPAGSRTAAAYLSIDNPLTIPVTLTGASCEGFANVMIHKTVIRDGMSRMTHAVPLQIDAGQRVQFAPGGLHLMLLQPLWTINEGEQLELTLIFDERPPLNILAQVRTTAP